jgi:hypothetical protein
LFDRGKSAATAPSTSGRHEARRLAAIVALILLLFAALAGAMSGTKTGTSTLQAGPASNVATVAFTLAALVGLALLAATVWGLLVRAHDDRDRPSRRRSTMLQRVAAGALVGALVGVGTLASRLIRHPRPIHVPVAAIGSSPSPAVAHSSLYFSRGAAAGTVAVVLALVLGALILSQVGAVRRRRPWSLGRLLVGAPGAPMAAGADRAVLAGTLASVQIPDPELEADPRRAVVAAYLAMTQAAAAAGARRRIDETPSEYLEHLLESLGASCEAAARLTWCFETARYSTKAVDETLRSTAIDALRQVRSELGAPKPDRLEPGPAMAPATT